MLARLLPKRPGSNPVLQAASLLLAASCLLVQAVNAQGLGELSVESALNEPLRASIELLETGGLEEGQIIVGLASVDEYEQAGLERSPLLSQIAFEVELAPDRNRILVTSQDAVNELFLSLLVNVRWPAGRVLRAYTVLLDLPDSRAANGGAGTARAAVTRAGAAEQTGSGAAASYTVEPGDSLWQIAEQTKPDDASVPQMMIAIQRANEGAFINNNVNRLISGRVLRIPVQDEVSVIGQAAAVAQINAQNEELGLLPLAAGSNTNVPVPRDQLSLTGGATGPAGGAGRGDPAAIIAALEAELLLSEEELDRARIENEELTARLGELEEQIAILQDIIAIENERIARLQDELAAQAEATEAALQEAAQAADALAAASAAGAPEGIAGRALLLLQNNLVFIGVALAAVLAVLGALVVRARRAADEADFETDAWNGAGDQRGTADLPRVKPAEPGFAPGFDERAAIAADEQDEAYLPAGGMDECDTKLDLAVAYEAMGDIDGAIEILDEVIAEGSPQQIEEARQLMAKWQDA